MLIIGVTLVLIHMMFDESPGASYASWAHYLKISEVPHINPSNMMDPRFLIALMPQNNPRVKEHHNKQTKTNDDID